MQIEKQIQLAKPTLPFDVTLEQSLFRYTFKLAQIINKGINPQDNFAAWSLPVHANNAAALGAGMIAGQLYRTGGDPDPVCIVH